MGFLLLAARWFLAGIFLRSGLVKATELAAFRSAVANYQLLPQALEKPVAVTLPVAEIVAAVMLAAGVMPVVVAAALALLLMIFAAAIGVNLARGRKFDCGCAGTVAPQMISWRHVAADLTLAAVAAAVALWPPAAAELWLGPAGPAYAVPDGGAFPVLATVLVCLVMAAVLRRAVVVRSLAAAVSGQLDAPSAAPDPGRQ